MNRADRRKAAKKAKKKATKEDFANYALKVLNKNMAMHMNDLRKKDLEEIFSGFLALFCLVLHDKFGFGKKRLTVVVSYAVEMFNDVADGRLTFDDMREAIFRETGIKL